MMNFKEIPAFPDTEAFLADYMASALLKEIQRQCGRKSIEIQRKSPRKEKGNSCYLVSHEFDEF
jgi:hypothetical protein